MCGREAHVGRGGDGPSPGRGEVTGCFLFQSGFILPEKKNLVSSTAEI